MDTNDGSGIVIDENLFDGEGEEEEENITKLNNYMGGENAGLERPEIKGGYEDELKVDSNIYF
jgi:hypothetical protein